MSWTPPKRIIFAAPAEKPAPAQSPAPDEKTALKALADLFKFNAMSRSIESGPYAAQSGKTKRCTYAASHGPCNLATKKTVRCDFHDNAAGFSTAGYTVEQVYEGAPIEAEITARLAALKM